MTLVDQKFAPKVVVLADLVQGDRLVQAKARASNYLRTFSDAQRQLGRAAELW